MKVVWIHGVSRLRSPSMSKWVEMLLPEMRGLSADLDISVDEIRGIGVPALKGLTNRYVLYTMHSLKLRGDLFHIHDHANSHLVPILPKESPKIVTVHDLYMLEGQVSDLRAAPFRLLNVRGIMRSQHIITVSAHMKEEIVKRLSYPPERISVIFCGIDHARYRPTQGREVLAGHYGLGEGKRYLLFVGSEEPRKNFPSVLHAFRNLLADHPDLILVKVGPAGSRRYRLQSLKAVEELGLKNQVVFCGHVPEEHLPLFYSHAEALVAPSYYEGGSGMHVMEAMACACPVVASQIPQAKELTGNAVMYCDPHDPDDIYAKTNVILTDEETRLKVVSGGLRRAQELSWERSAREHLVVYGRYLGIES